MQKRTNPLELKVDNAPRRDTFSAPSAVPVAEQPPIEPVAKAAEPTTVVPAYQETNSPEAQAIAPVVQQSAEKREATKPSKAKEQPAAEKKTEVKRPTVKKVASSVMQPIPEVSTAKSQSVYDRIETAPAMGGNVRWERVTSQKTARAVEPEQPEIKKPISVDKPEIKPVQAMDEVADDEFEENTAIEDAETKVDESIAASEEQDEDNGFDIDSDVVDENEPLTIEDYMMSTRFSLCGRVSRGLKIGKLSRDVCRLAQLMHPEKNLSAILEDALLTHIYLENPDAFDALVEMLEKKGGHVKC